MNAFAFHIIPVRIPPDLASATELFRGYANSLDIDLAYQDFEAEMAAMPGKYRSPLGALLLARDTAGEAIGCVGLRPIEPRGCCEMKRLYVTPAGRGRGAGRALVAELIATAQKIGYREMGLDTLVTMTAAQALYRELGFEVIPPYYDTPIADTVFMRRMLT